MSSKEGDRVEEADKDPCPLDCPNRRTDGRRQGITLRFGKQRTIHADPLEIMFVTFLLVPIIITARDAWTLSFRESIERVAMMSAAIYGVHKLPTGKLYDFLANTELK